MSKNKMSTSVFLAVLMLTHLSTKELYFSNIASIWVLLLIFSYQKAKNHLVSIMLLLELLSIMTLFAASFYVKLTTSLNLMFILMSMMVGEATLGLAVLISIARLNSNSLMMTTLN